MLQGCKVEDMLYEHYLPMETHDIGFVNDQMGCVVEGDALDEDFNRRILLPVNPQKRGRPQPRRRESQSRRRESQSQGKKVKRCSKCDQVGHYKNTCRNPQADFDIDYKGDLVKLLVEL